MRRSSWSRSSGRCWSRCSTRTRRSRASRCSRSRAGTRAETSRRAWPRRTSSSRPSTGPRPSCTTRSRPTRPSASGAATRSTSTSRRSTSGACGTRSQRRSACPPTASASSASSWAAASARRPAPAPTRCSPPSSRAAPGRPVRCALSRREENLVGGNRNATRQRVRAAARSDGTLTALEADVVAALGWDGWLPSTAGPMQMLYACDNVRTVEHGAKLNLPPMDAFRAPGFAEGTWALECLLDRLAAALDLDPLELRRRNHADGGHDRRAAVLVEAPAGVLPPRRGALGAPGRGARTLGRDLEARDGARQPDLVRRRRPALVRLGPGRLRRPRERRHGDAGHRHRHAHGRCR